MPIVAVHIPHIGEGLQEARLVAILKQPGDFVRRDEPIYQMETDKAVMDVESPLEGKIVSWNAVPDTLLPIGAQICTIEVADDASAPASEPAVESSEIVAINIPHIGEGLQEARLVAVLKQPGDSIRRDETIYQMETDKAIMDVESPYDGVLVEWLAAPDTLLPIGAEVGRMKVTGGAPVAATKSQAASAPAAAAPVATAPTAASAPAGARRTDIPPRTRAYAKEKGVSESQLQTIPAAGSKLMPSDIDAFLAGGAPAPAATTSNANYDEKPLSQKQRLLASRLTRGSQLVVPGTMSVVCDWSPIEGVRQRLKAAGGDFQPSAFTIFAYAVVRALVDFPALRSTMVGDGTLRTYRHANLGIAVALPGDELVIARVDQADTLSWPDFAAAARAQIDLARNGTDQANESVTISLTNMQAYNIRDAVAVVVPPSVATLFLGEPHYELDQNSSEPKMRRCVHIGLTFDHRLINGVGGAEFLNAVRRNMEQIEELLSAE